jgi:hypothetical protein
MTGIRNASTAEIGKMLSATGREHSESRRSRERENSARRSPDCGARGNRVDGAFDCAFKVVAITFHSNVLRILFADDTRSLMQGKPVSTSPMEAIFPKGNLHFAP